MNERLLSAILPSLADGETYFTVGLPLDKAQPPDVYKTTSIQCILHRAEQYAMFGLDSYMALASFGKDAGRTLRNAHALQCFWVDVDVQKPANSYPSIDEAFKDAQRFAASLNLQPSFVVSSGMGLHLYWALTKPLPVEQWRPIAQWFKQRAQQEKFIIDPACTPDAARILRIPGSIHMKTGRTVTVLADSGVRWEPYEFLQRISTGLTAPQTVAPIVPAPVDAPYMELYGMEDPPKAHAERIAKGCRQILTMGIGTEPQWYLAMNVLKRCVDGEQWAHALSACDTERYKAEDTAAKFARAKKNSPTTCATFQKTAPENCEGCIYAGQITSPIELDRYVKEEEEPHKIEETKPSAVAQAKQLSFELEEDRHYIPFTATPTANFYVDNYGIHSVSTVKEGDEYVDKDILICRTRLYFKRTELIYEDKSWQTEYIFEAIFPDSNKHHELRIVAAEYYMSPQRWLAEHTIFPLTIKLMSSLMAFINAYLEQVIHKANIQQKLKTYGWTVLDDGTLGFAVETGIITHTGFRPVSYDRDAADSTRKVFTSKGSLDAWAYIPKFYTALKQPVAQLMLCMTFAAPLMKYGSGEARNCFLNLYSAKGGLGKSTVLRFASSIWGDPEKSFFQKDTSNVAKLKRLGIWHNLPAMMDEITHVKEDDLSNLVFSIITGEEKQRLSQNSDFKPYGDWMTCVIATSNKAAKEIVARHHPDTDAGILRIMDYECDFEPFAPGSWQQQLYHICDQICRENYGLAGPEFIYQLLQREDRLRNLQNNVAAWVAQHNFSPRERFYSYPLGLGLTAGRWAKEFGLVDFDMDALEKWVLKEFVPALRKADQYSIQDPVEILQTYISENFLSGALVVASKDRQPGQAPVTDSSLPDGYVLRRPSRNLMMRLEQDTGILFISAGDFAKFCDTARWSVRAIINSLRQRNIIADKHVRISLGKHISWLPQDRVRCIKVMPSVTAAMGLSMEEEEEE